MCAGLFLMRAMILDRPYCDPSWPAEEGRRTSEQGGGGRRTRVEADGGQRRAEVGADRRRGMRPASATAEVSAQESADAESAEAGGGRWISAIYDMSPVMAECSLQGFADPAPFGFVGGPSGPDTCAFN